MGRKKKVKEETSGKYVLRKVVFEDPIPIAPIVAEEPIEVKKIPVMVPPIDPGVTMNEYLTNYSQKRSLDVVFTNWFKRKDPTNPLKPIAEWDELIHNFLNEVV